MQILYFSYAIFISLLKYKIIDKNTKFVKNIRGKTIIISAAYFKIPTQIKYLTTTFILPLPNRYDIKLEINRLINLLNIPVEKDRINKLRIIS
jgi:hypothetical protein